MSLAVRERLQDRYEVVRSIKSGGMGAVYEAVDHKLASTPCAIKEVLSSALQGSGGAYVLASFESEMRALAGLEHPNIPRVRDYFEIEGKRYIILDLVQGQGLDDELAEHLRLTNEPMDPAVAAVDMVQVLETLSYLHSCQPPIMHRDIKSANLIRDNRTGRIKLVDFGIARSVETQRVQTQVGTPGFCAPEQMAGRAELRSDLYSVGATLYHLCTGKFPPAFSFEALEMELPGSPGLVKIVLKATQPKPSDRYANAEEMAQALRAWLRNEGSAKIDPAVLPPEPVVTPIHPLATAPMPPNSQNGLWVAVLAMLLVALGLLYSDYSSRFGNPTPTPVAAKALPSASPSPPANRKVGDDLARRQAMAEKAAQQREARRLEQQRAELIQQRQRLAEEQARQEKLRIASEQASRQVAPRTDSGGDYPRSSVNSTPNTPPESPLRLTWNGPYMSRYEGNLAGHQVTLQATKTHETAWELRQQHADKIAGMRENTGREHSSGEYCGWRIEGNTHVGVHMRDRQLYELRVTPPPAESNMKVWDPIFDIIGR